MMNKTEGKASGIQTYTGRLDIGRAAAEAEQEALPKTGPATNASNASNLTGG